jgi:predicted alpha/beta hydrolase family esterase
MPPTIVLVHGAFAESASWDGVIDPLLSEGHSVIAATNPLRSLASDAASVSDVVRSIEGPVVLVAHSYGGAVISNVDPAACTASWPSVPGRSARSRSPAPRTQSLSRSPRRRLS